MMGAMLIYPQKTFGIGQCLDFVKKKKIIIFSSGDDRILGATDSTHVITFHNDSKS